MMERSPMTIDPTSARVQIQHTMAVYCSSVDSGDVEGVVSCFTEDCRLEVSSGAMVLGRSAIRGFYSPVIGPDRRDKGPDGAIPLLRHNLTTSSIELLGDDTATGCTYFMSLTRYGLDHAGRYFDHFARDGERWLISDRRIVVEWYGSPSWYEQVRLKVAAPAA
jgi:SnoaL-like domain